MKINPALITVENRYRKDYGDIENLADSISKNGLLHPPIIDYNYRLIDGERRLKAMQLLGMDEVEVRIVHVPSMLQAEHDANAFAKQWTVSERAAIGRAVEEFISQQKKEKQAIKTAWIENSRNLLVTGEKEPCFICGKYKAVSHAHHVVPLHWQYEHGFKEPNNNFVWLCPTHHVLAHKYIDGLIKNTFPDNSELPANEIDAIYEVISPFVDAYFKEIMR